jgi:hypothetical protein
VGRSHYLSGENSAMSAFNEIEREITELELELLRRGVDQRAAGQQSCTRCHRTPLIGERVYTYDGDRLLCELCRSRTREEPSGSRLVRTPEFGNTLRILDRRAA